MTSDNEELIIGGREEYNPRVNPESLEVPISPEEGVNMYEQFLKVADQLAALEQANRNLIEKWRLASDIGITNGLLHHTPNALYGQIHRTLAKALETSTDEAVK